MDEPVFSEYQTNDPTLIESLPKEDEMEFINEINHSSNQNRIINTRSLIESHTTNADLEVYKVHELNNSNGSYVSHNYEVNTNEQFNTDSYHNNNNNINRDTISTRSGVRLYSEALGSEDERNPKRARQSFEQLPYNIVINIFSYIEQIISIDYQHTLQVTTLPATKRWDPKGKDWMIFDLRKKFPKEARSQPWIATRQDILIFSLYGRFRNDEEKKSRLLWTSLQFACPYPDNQYREHMNNATPGFSCIDYIPWGQVANLRLSGFFSPYSLKYLKFANNIEYLSIEADNLENPYFQVTNKTALLFPKQLQYLDLSYVNIDEDAIKGIFERLPNLKVVGMNGIKGGIKRASTARLINQAPDLIQLELRHNSITDEVATEFFKNCKLTFLSLSQNPISPKGWHNIKYNTTLTTLQFYETTIDDHFLDLLAQHPLIKDIHMEACVGFTDEGLQRFITQSTRIESISIARCKLSSFALQGISNNSKLKSLYLDFNTNLSIEIFKELSKIQNLRDLSVVGCQITDEHVEALLQNNNTIQNLFLSNNDKIGWGTINVIIQNRTLRYLILAMCPLLTDEMIDKLILKNEGIRHLILDSNKQLTDQAIINIGQSPTITSLSALSTKISEDMFKKIVYEHINILSYNSQFGEYFRPEF